MFEYGCKRATKIIVQAEENDSGWYLVRWEIFAILEKNFVD